MGFRLSDLQATVSSVFDDIFHLRTSGGLDKKITLPNLRSSIFQNINKGITKVTLSNYDNDSAPVVKVGSVFDNAGETINVETSDKTPTGYAGISVSTTFYLYWDTSASAFVYSSTAPTWSTLYQGWYSGDDRALFSMYKDSGGTQYQRKWGIGGIRNLFKINTIVNGDYLFGANIQYNFIFDKLDKLIPNTDDLMLLNGGYSKGGVLHNVAIAERTDSTHIVLHGVTSAGNTSLSLLDGSASTITYTALTW